MDLQFNTLNILPSIKKKKVNNIPGKKKFQTKKLISQPKNGPGSQCKAENYLGQNLDNNEA